MKMFKNSKKGPALSSSKGFTLIELLVVIAIIGILSSVVLASLNSARQKGRDSKRLSDLKQLQLAYEMYFDSCRQYPPEVLTTYTLPLLTEGTGCGGTATIGTFLNQLPVDPTNNAAYTYRYSRQTTTTYCIGNNFESTTPTGSSTCTVPTFTLDYTVSQ